MKNKTNKNTPVFIMAFLTYFLIVVSSCVHFINRSSNNDSQNKNNIGTIKK